MGNMKISVLFIFLLIASSILAQQPIDTTEILTIGGIKQYISIKGKDRSKPLLLYLHGGPGGSVMTYANKFTSRLQENFIVVQWDQRETGKTLQLNASPTTLTLHLFENDTHDLIESLLKQFKLKKIYLVGHSWGTVLGFYIASSYPDLLYAFVAISPVINQLESERIILVKMKERAKQTGNKIGIEELSFVKIPFENGEQLYYDRKWLFNFNGQTVKTFTKKFAMSWSSIWLPAWNEASKINRMESLLAVNCPVYFFVGKKDYQTNFSITENYYTMLIAPKKELFWFELSGHSIPTTEPALLQDIIIKKIFPETITNPHNTSK